MKIVQIVPGSGDNFYCENCVRDNSLVRALLARGEQVLAVPLYLPREIDTLDQTTDAPLFFGGINSYLQQKSGLFRHTPRWFDRLLDSRFLLRMAAHRAGSVRASGLGEMTLSMLQGRAGHQKKELERLIDWLGSIGKVDVVHISSPLLLGIGEEVKRRLGLPIVCTMQDEDTWIDAMDDPYPARCWDAMREAAAHVDVFVGVSRYFADVMQERMKLPADRVRVVPIGVDVDAFATASAPVDPPVLGYLSRMSEPLGLGVLVDAFLRLKKTPGLEGLKLHASGGSTADDKPFLTRLHRTLASEGVADDVRFFDHFDPDARREMLFVFNDQDACFCHGRRYFFRDDRAPGAKHGRGDDIPG